MSRGSISFAGLRLASPCAVVSRARLATSRAPRASTARTMATMSGASTSAICSESKLGRINAGRQEFTTFAVTFAGQRQGDLEVLSERHQLFFALEPILPAPQFAASRRNLQVQSPGSLMLYGFSLGFARLISVSAMQSFRNDDLEIYPQLERGIPPQIPPSRCGFHSTPLDDKNTKPQHLLGF